MNQFEEIRSKNERIAKIIVGLAVFVAAAALFLLFAYIYVTMSIVKITDEIDYELRRTDQQISQERAAEYVDKLENMPLKFIFADQCDYNLYLSRLYEITSEYDKMIITAEKAVKTGGENPIAHYYLGLACYKNNEYDRAEKEFNEAISFENTFRETYDKVEDYKNTGAVDEEENNETLRGRYLYYIEYTEGELPSLIYHISLLKHISFKDKINIYKALTDIYIQKKDLEKAKESLGKAAEEKIFFTEYYESLKDDASMDKNKIVNEFAKKIVIAHSDNEYKYINEISELDYGLDTDNDGLSNSLENVLGTDKYKEDTDGDGFDDKKELITGYDPLIKSPEDEMDDVDYYNLYIKIIDL